MRFKVKLTDAQNLIENLKTADLSQYEEIKKNTEEVKKTWGGKRPFAGRKPKNENNILSFQMKVSEREQKFLKYARSHNLNYEDLMQG